MADISEKIKKKSLKAKRKTAIKTIKAQSKEKIREVKIMYAYDSKKKETRLLQKEQKRALKEQKKNARIAYNERQPKQFSLAEDLFNSISHGIGAGLSAAAIVLLVLQAALNTPAGHSRALYVTCYAIFGSSLFILYMMSTLNHALQGYTVRKVFSILTHDAIFLLIAGTYTPYMLIVLGGHDGWAWCIGIWIACAAFIALYSVFHNSFRRTSVPVYLALGWIVLAAFSASPLSMNINVVSKAFLAAGGVAYTVGSIFYLMKQYKWTHTIFHLFIMIGSVLHFFSIYYLI